MAEQNTEPLFDCDHLWTVYYDRPWWRMWRKRIVLACWRCDDTWPEP